MGTVTKEDGSTTLSVNEAVNILKVALEKAEQIRASVGGEVAGKTEGNKYKDVVEMARTFFDEADSLLTTANTREEIVGLTLVASSSALLAAGTLESMSKHSMDDPAEINSALDQALGWLSRLDKYSNILDSTHYSLHGPTLWRGEQERSTARTFERRPGYRNNNLTKAAEHYKRAVEFGIKVLTSLNNEGGNEVLNAARSVTGVAMGELARTYDMLIHEFGEDYSEEEILDLYANGCDMVWDTLDIPNMDRVDTVLQRFLDYLVIHDVPKSHFEFQKTINRFAELEQLEKDNNLGLLVADRNRLREKKYQDLFS